MARQLEKVGITEKLMSANGESYKSNRLVDGN
jgi:hypothetical protein